VLPLQEGKIAVAPAVAEVMRPENPVLAPDRPPSSAPEPLVQPPFVPAPSEVQVVGLIQPTTLAMNDLDSDDDL
jgi:hypothetical protein